MLKGKRTLATNIVFIVFCAYMAWICKGDFTGASTMIIAAGAAVFGSKVANAIERRAENGKPKT